MLIQVPTLPVLGDRYRYAHAAGRRGVPINNMKPREWARIAADADCPQNVGKVVWVITGWGVRDASDRFVIGNDGDMWIGFDREPGQLWWVRAFEKGGLHVRVVTDEAGKGRVVRREEIMVYDRDLVRVERPMGGIYT